MDDAKMAKIAQVPLERTPVKVAKIAPVPPLQARAWMLCLLLTHIFYCFLGFSLWCSHEEVGMTT
jgi:hypothetical protein